MNVRVVKSTKSGSVVEIEETTAERYERALSSAQAAAKKVHFTPGQRKVLAAVQRRARKAN